MHTYLIATLNRIAKIWKQYKCSAKIECRRCGDVYIIEHSTTIQMTS